MSKKQKQTKAQVEETVSENNDQISQGVVEVKTTTKTTTKTKVKMKSKDDKNKKKKEKSGGLGKKVKETASELKKVTWPTFAEVVKKTGIVIAFVLIFGLFIFGLDSLLGWLVGLLAG